MIPKAEKGTACNRSSSTFPSILFARVLALLTVGDRVKIIKDSGLASISLFGSLMAILIGTGLVYKEIEKRTIFTLLSKPLRRHEFLLGKFLGLVLTLAVLLAAMSLIFLVLVLFHTGTIEWSLLLAVLYIFFELILITAVAILFSSFSTPILSSLFVARSGGVHPLSERAEPGIHVAARRQLGRAAVECFGRRGPVHAIATQTCPNAHLSIILNHCFLFASSHLHRSPPNTLGLRQLNNNTLISHQRHAQRYGRSARRHCQ